MRVTQYLIIIVPLVTNHNQNIMADNAEGLNLQWLFEIMNFNMPVFYQNLDSSMCKSAII